MSSPETEGVRTEEPVVRLRGISKKFPGVLAVDGVDLDRDTAPDEVKAVEDGVVSALVAQNPFRMGYDGVNAAVGAIRGGGQLKDIDTGSTLVTQDNLDDPEVKAVLDPSCSNKPVVSEQ